jgi:outer membrane receptor protein involved in Fe transport
MYQLKYVIYLVSMVLLSHNLFAQSFNDGIVTGSIIAKSTKKPIENISVVLFDLGDSTIVSGTMTDAKGRFVMNHIPDGNYYIVFGCIGYKESNTGAFSIDAKHKNLDLGILSMLEAPVPLKGTVVTGERPTLNTSIDRKVYNIEKDIMGQAASASELLQNIPSVSVDIDGNVSLRGSGNVLILINGRTSPLMGKTRADVLQQMPANSIERIEVITNPSAKYKPDGTSGIINLVLKKNAKAGLGGTISANGGPSNRYNGNVSLNYNPGRFNLYGSYGLRKDSRNRNSIDSGRYYYQNSDTNSYYNQDNETFDRPLSHIASLGVDYNLDEKNSFGISGNYFYKGFTRTGISRNISLNHESAISNEYTRSRFDPEYERDNEATAYFDHSFAKKDHKLHIEFNISDQPEQEDNHYTDTYVVPDQMPQYDNTLIKQGEKQNQSSIEYANPLSENSTFESGFTREVTKQDFDFYAEYFDNNRQAFVTDVAKTNRFLYDESINALYGTLEHSFGQFSFLGGLRFEYVLSKSNLVTTGSTFKNDYLSLYPSLHLSYKLSESSELQLNYSRRTNRPEGDDLNPFPEYSDPLHLRAGNPHLLPEYIHSVEFGWQWLNNNLKLTPSIYYRYRYNGFTSVTEVVQDTVLLTTVRNLSSDQSAGLELVVSGSLADYLTTDINTNIFYNTIDASDIGFSKRKSIISWSGNFNINLKLKPITLLQINSYYRSSRLTPQGKYLGNFVANFGVRHNLVEDKLSLVLTISDIFKTRNQKLQLRTSGLDRDVKTTRDAQTLYAGLICYFGTSSKKNKEKPLEYDNNQ